MQTTVSHPLTAYCDEYWKLYEQWVNLKEQMCYVNPSNRDRLLAEYRATEQAITDHRATCGCHKRKVAP